MKQVFLIVGLLITTLSCFSQIEVQYQNWSGESSELIHYEKTSSSLRMTIISTETKDTIILVIATMNSEVQGIIEHLETHKDADDCWVCKEPNYPELFSVHLRKPYHEDTTIRAHYVNSYDEADLIPKAKTKMP